MVQVQVEVDTVVARIIVMTVIAGVCSELEAVNSSKSNLTGSD